MERDTLIKIVLEEADRMISDTMVIRSELKIEVTVHREVELS
jgi:hypothetical protein